MQRAPTTRTRVRALLALVLALAPACVSPRHPAPPPNERDPAEVREECHVRGAGGFINGLAGFLRAKS